MAWTVIPPSDVDANSIIDESLMSSHIKNNDDDHEARILALEGGGGGSGSSSDTNSVARIISGGETNEAIYWKRRFHPSQHMRFADNKNNAGFDPEEIELKNQLLEFSQSNETGVSSITFTNYYLGKSVQINKDSSVSFKIKKGINFFSIGSLRDNGSSDNVEILIDGQTPSSLSLVDENGNPAPNSFTANSVTDYFQAPVFFYGLDGNEHIVTIKNNDSASKRFIYDFIEVGFKSSNPTIDSSVKLNAGKAIIKGSEASFAETSGFFGGTELYGHTGVIACDNSGVTRFIDGESPAQTQCKPEEQITFSSPVSTLKVKNNFYFPSNGICLISTPHGNHHLFSYESKTDTLIQSHSFDSIIWQSQPSEDFTPLNNFTGGAGEATGDLNICYWGTAPILIDATNNKIDFEISVLGITTSHTATIANGRYSADLVPLEKAVNTAMQTAKPINGKYAIKYKHESQLWSIYIDNPEVESIDFLFSSGANSLTSVHTTLGFSSSDITGLKSYIGNTEVQHLSGRVFQKEKVFISPDDPRIKYDQVNLPNTPSNQLDIENRLNIGRMRRLGIVPANLFQIFVDNDCCGLEMSFMKNRDTGQLTFQIDDGQALYLTNTNTAFSDADSPLRGSLMTAFICFPRGSKKITIRNESTDIFDFGGAGSNQIHFSGARQYFTKPPTEKLTKNESILKAFDISPISLYETPYGHNSGSIYSPAAQDDQINTITESGSWAAGISTESFNQGGRTNASALSFVDINFTVTGNGGAVGAKVLVKDSLNTAKISCFLSQSVINEGTDRIQNVHLTWNSDHHDTNIIYIPGLSAGTYTLRIKNEQSVNFFYSAILIADTVPPQENATSITDINNTGQGIAYPVNVIRESVMQDSGDRVPMWLQRSGYKEGFVTNINYSFNSPDFSSNIDDSSFVKSNSTTYYANYVEDSIVSNEILFSGFCKSIAKASPCSSTNTQIMQPFIDGIQTLNTVSQRTQVKGGSSPSTLRLSSSVVTDKIFNLSCSFSAGNTFNVSDTRGIRVGECIILNDGLNEEKAIVDSVVIGVSFTVKKSRSIVIDANVSSVGFQGFHTFKIVSGDSLPTYYTSFEYEPLKVNPSRSTKRINQDFVYERVAITFEAITNGDDAYYPIHSDGVSGNWSTSTISMKDITLVDSYSFNEDLKNIQVSLGGSMDFTIISERLVPLLNTGGRF